MDILIARGFFLWLGGLFLCSAAMAAEIPELSFERLSDKDISPQGRAALLVDKDRWKHSETAHFVYHYSDAKLAETVYVHAEVQYGWIKEMFGVEKDPWAKKGHIFIFETEENWKKFNTKGGEKFLGFAGFTDGWELYMRRAPYWLSPQKTLAHELTHIVLFRFLDGNIPLFLNEGFAEFMATKAVAVQTGGNEYNIRILQLILPEKYIPLKELARMKTYPEAVEVFYQESELLVRYLILNHGSKNFFALLKKVSQGSDFEKAIKEIYQTDLRALEEKFKAFALQKSPRA